MAELNIPTVELHEAHQLALATWGQMCDASIQALVEKFGTVEAIEILRPCLEKVGEPAPIFADMMGISGNDATTIASLFCLYEQEVLKVEGKVTESSPDRVVKESYQCPFQSLSPGFCQAFTIVAEGMGKAINPKYEVTTTKMMTAGDRYCEWIIEKTQ